MSPFLLCHCVAVPWCCSNGCVSCIVLRGGCVSVTLRVLRCVCCVACVALRVLRCVCCVAWRLRFVVLRVVALRPRRSCSVSGGCSLPRRASPYWFRAPPSTKSAFLCAFWLRDPHFLPFRAQNRQFCVRMGDFSEIFGRFDTKMGFLCSGSLTIVVPVNHREHFKNVNTL